MKKHECARMFLLIAVWAVIGALVGHSVAPKTSLLGVLVGSITGFVAGFLASDFRRTREGIKMAPVVFWKLVRFLRLTAALIYSDNALVCGIFAALGTATGYIWFDHINVVLWAGAAGILGVVSKELLGARVVA